MRGIGAATRSRERVERALDMVQLRGFGARRPAQLSGGQQQRVAVARALVFEPKLVLMDEPLGALDKQLREQMQLEVRRLHQRLGVTMVYVTHDQHEALTMSDRIAVFHRGRVQQLDSPERIYEQPANAFVARFIGENNRLERRASKASTATAARCASPATRSSKARWRRRSRRAPRSWCRCGPSACKSAAPHLQSRRTAIAASTGRLREVIYLGDHVRARIALPSNDDFTVKRPIDDVHRLPAIGQGARRSSRRGRPSTAGRSRAKTPTF